MSGAVTVTIPDAGIYKMCVSTQTNPSHDLHFLHIAGALLHVHEAHTPAPPLPSPPPPKPLHPPQPSPPPPGGPPPPPYAPLPPQPQRAVIVDGCGAVVSRCADKLEHAAIRCCGPSTLSCAASVCAPSSHRSPGDGLGLLGTDTDGHAATLEDAAFECMARGARLCDASELMAGACCGTGCGHNSRLVWSATSCVPPRASYRNGRSHSTHRGRATSLSSGVMVRNSPCGWMVH